ncbi:unnamed protein product, partial [Auanema sp. JU1783]
MVENGYNCDERLDIWLEYFGKICAVLEGDRDMIERIVREYFLSCHSGERSDFAIRFSDKVIGTSIGNICDVKFSGVETRFYVKSHQRGLRPESISIRNRYSSIEPPFIQEMYLYKLLSLLGVGGDVHFILPMTSNMKKALFFATEAVDFTIAKNLTVESANVTAMLLVYYLEVIFQLEDIGTNRGNFGQSPGGTPVIIDFLVSPKDNFVLSDSQIDDLWGELRNCSRFIADVIKGVTREERKKIVHKAVEDWDLVSKIDEAKLILDAFLLKNSEKLVVTGDLNLYVRDIKSNIAK